MEQSITTQLADDDALPSDLAGIDAILISSSVSRPKVGDTFAETQLPLLTWEGFLLDELNMTTGPNGETATTFRSINYGGAGSLTTAGGDVIDAAIALLL